MSGLPVTPDRLPIKRMLARRIFKSNSREEQIKSLLENHFILSYFLIYFYSDIHCIKLNTIKFSIDNANAVNNIQLLRNRMFCYTGSL